MNAHERLKKLGEHYKCTRGTQNLAEWSKSIKKAAKAEDDSIEVIYDRVFPSGKVPVVIEGKAVEINEKTELPSPTTAISQSHTVDVKAPQFVINIPAPSVSVGHEDNEAATWVYTFERVARQSFVFGSGTLFGVLVSKSVLNALGVV